MNIKKARATGLPFKRPHWDRWVLWPENVVEHDADTQELVGWADCHNEATDFIVRSV
jgi:hypothetical protein